MNKYFRVLIIGGILMALNMSVLAKDSIIKVIGIEGGYSNHISDIGGQTRYGITIKVARRFGYKGKMQDLPYEVAMEIYHKNYWKRLRLDQINDDELAYAIMDAGINMGTCRSIMLLQSSYNMLLDGSPLKEDGLIGKNTINKINSYKDKRRLRIVFEANKIHRYVEITKARSSNEDFIAGWLFNRTFLGGMR